MQRIFHLYVQEGYSINAIAKRLTQERIPTQRDRRSGGPQRKFLPGVWHPASVHDVLTNETYIGTLFYGKTTRVASVSAPDKKTTYRRTPKEDWIAIPVPPIIDRALFEAAQAQRVRNAQESRRNRKHDYLFGAGRLRCGQCGCAMHGQCDTRNGRLLYRCTRPRYQTDTPCRGTVGAKQLEGTVWHAVETALRNPALIATALEQRAQGMEKEQTDLEREREQYHRQLLQCEKDVKRWEAAYLGEAIDLEDFKAKKAEIAVRRASAERELTRLEEQERFLQQTRMDLASLTEYCQRVHANLTRFDNAEKRVAMQALNITVVWHRAKPLDIQGHIPVAIVSNAPYCRPRHAPDRGHRC